MREEGRSAAQQERVLSALSAAQLEPDVFDPRDLALLHYADKLTRDPSSVKRKDIVSLRAAGFDDLAIHDACTIVAYYAFVNRIADGLGVELEG